MHFGSGLSAEHYMLVAPPWMEGSGGRFSARDYVRAAVDSGVNCVEVYIKDHHGTAFYDTKAGYKCASMPGDYLADLCEAGAAHNVDIYAYYSVGFDNWCADRHPDWCMRTADGRAVGAGLWSYMCPNTGYRDFMLAQVAEIAAYPVRGLWFDILRFPELARGACFCASCRAAYIERTGNQAPGGFGQGAASRAYVAFLEDSMKRLLVDFRRVCGDKEYSFNGAGFLSPADWNELCDWHNVEGHAPDYADQSYKSRYLASLGRPWEILSPGDCEGWASMTVKPLDAMKVESAIAEAQGGVMTFGLSPDGDGDSENAASSMPGYRANVKALNAGKRDFWSVGAGQPMANVCILNTISTQRALIGGSPNPGMDFDLLRLSRGGLPSNTPTQETSAEAYGYHGALVTSGCQYRVINEYGLDHLATADLVVVPDQRHLNAGTLDRLRAFAEAGGNLLVTGQSALFDSENARAAASPLLDLAGVRHIGGSGHAHCYVTFADASLAEGLTDRRLLVTAPSQLIEPVDGTSVLATAVFPEAEAARDHFFFHRVVPPRRDAKPVPFLTRRAVGRGHVHYIAATLGKDFVSAENPSIAQAIRNIVAAVSRDVVRSPQGLEVALTYHSVKGIVRLHIVNHFSSRLESLPASRVLRDVEISIDGDWLVGALGRKVAAAIALPSREAVPVLQDGGRTIVRVPSVGTNVVVELSGT
jgi:hypothetical protein